MSERAPRVILVHPGASFSTHDVYIGLGDGLKAMGYELYAYPLDQRIEAAGQWLNYIWKKNKKNTPKPTPHDILQKAGEELIARGVLMHPDVVLIVSGMYLHPDVLLGLHRGGVPTALLFTESPYDDERQQRLIDRVGVDVSWTNERVSAREMGIKYLPHAFHPMIHTPTAPIPDDVPAHDVVFVGTGFQERIDVLEAVDWTGIDFGLYGTWELLSRRSPLKRFIRDGYVSNGRATALYRRAKIGLNLHRQSKGFGKDAPRITHAESLNPRAYELAATGCFTISDDRAEVSEVFGQLVPTFATPADLSALLRTWLADDSGRARIQRDLPSAVAGQSWVARAATVHKDLVASGLVAGRRPSLSPSLMAVGG